MSKKRNTYEADHIRISIRTTSHVPRAVGSRLQLICNVHCPRINNP